jgi:hypothetical protein
MNFKKRLLAPPKTRSVTGDHPPARKRKRRLDVATKVIDTLVAKWSTLFPNWEKQFPGQGVPRNLKERFIGLNRFAEAREAKQFMQSALRGHIMDGIQATSLKEVLLEDGEPIIYVNSETTTFYHLDDVVMWYQHPSHSPFLGGFNHYEVLHEMGGIVPDPEFRHGLCQLRQAIQNADIPTCIETVKVLKGLVVSDHNVVPFNYFAQLVFNISDLGSPESRNLTMELLNMTTSLGYSQAQTMVLKLALLNHMNGESISEHSFPELIPPLTETRSSLTYQLFDALNVEYSDPAFVPQTPQERDSQQLSQLALSQLALTTRMGDQLPLNHPTIPDKFPLEFEDILLLALRADPRNKALLERYIRYLDAFVDNGNKPIMLPFDVEDWTQGSQINRVHILARLSELDPGDQELVREITQYMTPTDSFTIHNEGHPYFSPGNVNYLHALVANSQLYPEYASSFQNIYAALRLEDSPIYHNIYHPGNPLEAPPEQLQVNVPHGGGTHSLRPIDFPIRFLHNSLGNYYQDPSPYPQEDFKFMHLITFDALRNIQYEMAQPEYEGGHVELPQLPVPFGFGGQLSSEELDAHLNRLKEELSNSFIHLFEHTPRARDIYSPIYMNHNSAGFEFSTIGAQREFPRHLALGIARYIWPENPVLARFNRDLAHVDTPNYLYRVGLVGAEPYVGAFPMPGAAPPAFQADAFLSQDSDSENEGGYDVEDFQ